MKKFTLLALGFLAAIAPLSAQDDTQPQPGDPDRDGPSWKQHGKKHGPAPGASLSPEERRKLAAAREKADEDPTVQSLRDAKDKVGEPLANAMRAAMLAADPSLGPTLDKIKEARDRAKEMKERFRSLSPEQKRQLKAARGTAKDDPAVQAAREKMRGAQGPEARREAGREMHQAMKAAMLKADPSLAPLLEKLGPGIMGRDRGPQGDGSQGPPPPSEMDGPPDDVGL